MFVNIVLAYFRSQTRHPLYAGLNLLGLGFGIAVFLTLGLFVRFETSFERWLPDVERIEMMETSWHFANVVTPTSEYYSMGGLIEEMLEENPRLVGTRALDREMAVHTGADVRRETEELVDPDFFKVFDLPLVAGDKRTALSSSDDLVLTAQMARKYFGSTDVIGKSLRITDAEGSRTATVTAVLADLPRATDLRFDFLRLLGAATRADRYWHNYGSSTTRTFFRLQPAEAAEVNAHFDDFVDRRAGRAWPGVPHESIRLRLMPLTALHLADPTAATAVMALGLVGLLALVIAAINYINLATARAGLRAREVAVRKTLGATAGLLRLQFLAEAVFTTLLASLIGLALVELSLPLINQYGGLRLVLDYRADAPALAVLIVVILAIGLLAGFYPAMVLSSFQPAAVLASSRMPAGGRLAGRVREGLVLAQFSVVIAFFIMVAGFVGQLTHLERADLGFRRDGLLLSTSTRDPALSEAQRDAIWAAWRGLPGVVLVSASDSAPGDQDTTNFSSVKPSGYEGEAFHLQWTVTGPDYFTLYGGHLLAGRLFDPAFGADELHADGHVWSDANVILNERAIRLLGYVSPEAALGQRIAVNKVHMTVVGVVGDMRFVDPHKPISPEMYLFQKAPSAAPVSAVRFEGVAEPAMRARLGGAWRSIAPEVPFEAVSAADNLDQYYRPDRNRSHLFAVGATVAGLIGCVGLYGLAAFNTSRRSREIGLRKVLGASRGAVVGLLLRQAMRPVLIANLIAWPAAAWALSSWLAQFDDRIGLNLFYFLGASAVAMLIAVATVGGLAFAGASGVPGAALRHE